MNNPTAIQKALMVTLAVAVIAAAITLMFSGTPSSRETRRLEADNIMLLKDILRRLDARFDEQLASLGIQGKGTLTITNDTDARMTVFTPERGFILEPHQLVVYDPESGICVYLPSKPSEP